MKISIKHLLFISVSLPLLSGCSATEAGQGPVYFGSAVRQNIAAQIVNPEAAENNSRVLVYSGERAALAQKHYVLDSTEKARAPKTSTMSVSGGSQ